MKAYGKSWGYNVYDCRYCLYRKGKLKGCVYPDGCCCPVPQKPARRNGIEQVYDAAADNGAPVSECEGCPYGRAAPCIGWCTKVRQAHLPHGAGAGGAPGTGASGTAGEEAIRAGKALSSRQRAEKDSAFKARGKRAAMMNFTNDEMNLMCIYQSDSRSGLIAALTEMRGYLDEDEAELRELTDSALQKLSEITDEDFAELELIPDFDTDE